MGYLLRIDEFEPNEDYSGGRELGRQLLLIEIDETKYKDLLVNILK